MNSNVNVSRSILLWMSEQKDIFGPMETRTEVMKKLKKEPHSYKRFQKLSPKLQEEFLDFCMGKRGLKITYDPVFKMVFNPEAKPGRLEEFLSLCLGEQVKILQVMPNESERLTEEGSFLVMDILVKLESGALVNVEIQRLGYLFPGARCACYSSDLMMRQYSQMKNRRREEGTKFSYKDIKKVYTIVLIQKSTGEFRDFPGEYLHYGRQTFVTGLNLDMLQEYLLIPLDIFLANQQHIRNKLDAWLYFISSDKPEDMKKVLEAYPEFKELYQEVFHFRYRKKELLGMYSEALQMLDLGTAEYMVEVQQEEIEKNQRELEKSQKEIEKNQKEIEKNQKEIEKNQKEIEKLQKEKTELQMKVEALEALLKEKERQE